MDMYLSASDSVSLQEMLDIDIKSEIETLVGGHNDLSGLNFSDLPPLDIEESTNIRWISSNSNHSNSSFNLDFNGEDGSTMVNPNAVMPISLAQSIRSPSPTLKESHLTFSPSSIKITSLKTEAAAFKRDILQKLNLDEKKTEIKTTKVTPILAKPIIKTVNNKSTLLSFKNTVQHHFISSVGVTHINGIGNVRTIATNTHHRKQQLNNNQLCGDLHIYPKPAYSYSCLIAMALKNSHTGSLPVSEIYNFMCRHFPYFKTAPNGWKNSVRHNLSLNKCFEKIEKPAINGAQRKGCLWAMNPAKIVKMDEEVQKWSRKDPSAIKKAMVNPENLESLERGELKFTYEDADNFGDSCGSAESEEGSDAEADVEVVEHNYNSEPQFFDISAIKSEDDDIDIEDTELVYDEMDIENDKEVLRVEVALAQKELLEYGRCAVNGKKRKIYYLQD
ncbi:hypothetical protein PPYR_11477 [Photinus pyralis]|uniref:Fork-head domain-containing protein n=1 Tax=Photinus pyralis TaxID=7054 RepID=A0A1Y1NFL0_PHOPY|nr:uncharacterized protein LOC116175672 [Photinus pyralis]XP_031349768.1 uncharacterized protein LOC116175672 [Photinus pyralis]KAB0794638.1 hypothetical protein PPYR_11477 [Photinus pyralis]